MPHINKLKLKEVHVFHMFTAIDSEDVMSAPPTEDRKETIGGTHPLRLSRIWLTTPDSRLYN